MNGSAPASTREQEWQFAATELDGARRWLAAQPNDPHERRFEAGSTLDLSDTYYDSPDWMIFRAGFALRLRRSRDSHSETTEVTLKSLTPARGAFAQRTELSQRVAATDIDGVLAQPDGIGDRIRELVGTRRLSVLFHARTKRERQRLLEADNELPLAEVDLDETVILSPSGQTQSLNRVEVECLNAEPAALDPVVQSLRDFARLTPVDGSKFRTGLAVAGLTPGRLVELGPRTFHAAQPFPAALLAILRRYFSACIEAEPLLRAGSATAVHDMRVAARHIDTLLRALGEHTPVWIRESHGAVRSLVKALGAVRDSDVQLAHLDEQRRSHAADAEALVPLRERIAGERDRARARLMRELDSPPARAWRESWIENLRNPDAPVIRDARSTGEVALDAIRREARRLRKRADALGEDSSPDDYHRVRVRAKRLRYVVEAFEGLYGPASQEFGKALAKLQDVLGDFNDSVVREQRFTELVTSTALPAATSFAIGRLVERDRGSFEKCRERFPKAYRRIRKRRWRALLAAMRRQARARV